METETEKETESETDEEIEIEMEAETERHRQRKTEREGGTFNSKFHSVRLTFCVAVFSGCIEEGDTTGFKYRGEKSTTRTGRVCQRWDSQEPNSHNKTDM